MLSITFSFTYSGSEKAVILPGSKSTLGRTPAQNESFYLQFGEISSVSKLKKEKKIRSYKYSASIPKDSSFIFLCISGLKVQ